MTDIGTFLSELRKTVENDLAAKRDLAGKETWPTSTPQLLPDLIDKGIVQTYILLKILERLDGIEKRLGSRGN
jgi:hypothetical protein